MSGPTTGPTTGRTTGRHRIAHALFAIAFVAVGLAILVPSSSSSASALDDGSITRSVTATRVFVDENGNQTVAESDDVTLEVSQATNLRGRQEIHVAWSGAHPTGGVVGDPNSSDGRNQEYPFVLLQCRGVDDDTVPSGQVRLSPETCWTQTSTERYFAAASQTPAWRFDAQASATDRGAIVGRPDALPAACAAVSEPLTARWLPFRAEDGTVYYGGPDPGNGCMPLAPESDSAESGGLPSNTTYGITGSDGRGETDFSVWTGAENGSLGCSVDVACALVAVPILGISCDAWGTRLPAGTQQTTKTGVPLTASQQQTADTTCRRTGAYLPGQTQGSTTSDQAVRGSLWWSASNWANRITVPLDFAPTGAVCDAVSKEAPLEVLGSTVLNELTASWRPTFCTSADLFTFTHVQQADSLARNLVNRGEVKAAFSTAPKDGGYSRPVVQAPVAVGGFAIAFTIDDENGRRRERLRLNARLVAKLLTSSYPAVSVVRDNHPSIGSNPLNITLDPEFWALNPGLPRSTNLEAAAALQIFSSSSDLMWALTSWIDGDPEARAWLDGTPDPWGMTVNAAYDDIALPVDNWPLLDGFVAPQWYQDQNACYGHSPTPFMQLIANPQSNLSAVLFNMQYATSTAQLVCRYDGYDATTLPLRAQGRQLVGHRFVLGLVSTSAAARYHLRTASLQTTVEATGDDFDPVGRTFVDADEPGLAAGARLLRLDAAAKTWELDTTELSTPAGRGAYPGTMPVYAVVPTRGLDAASATKLGKLLCYASEPGQVSGPANGQLPAGYLPMTDANGLTAQRSYLLSSIAAVRAQTGSVPSPGSAAPDRSQVCDFTEVVDSAPPSSSATPTASSTPTEAPSDTASPTPTDDPEPSESSAESPSTSPDVDVPVVSVPDAPPPVASAAGGKKPTASAEPTPTTEAQTYLTTGQTSLFGRLGVPGLLVLAVSCALAGAYVRWYDPIARAVSALKGRLR